MSSPDESSDLTPESSSPEKAEVLSTTLPSTATKTKMCSYCSVEVGSRGHFQHEAACARKIAKKSARESSANQSTSTPISDERKGNYSKCSFCSELRHSGSMKSHREKCVKYWKLVKNGTDCGICSKSFGSRSDVYGHLSRSHDQAAQYDALLEHDKQGQYFIIFKYQYF
jgi:hypothetical protein